MARRSPCLAFRVAFAASVVLVVPCAAHEAACRDGSCDPRCTVRPAQFGYYPTQWRRWPGGEPRSAAADAATPVKPAPSVVPGPDEESPETPPPASPAAAAAGMPADRIGRLAEEADAARLADDASQRRFTERLVTAMLSEHDPRVRCAILTLAAGFATPAAEAICAGALDDPDPRVRLAACRVCVGRRGPEFVDRLVRRAREDEDLGVRLRAIRALGESRDAAAVSHLVALLDDPDPAVRSRTTAALALATGRDLGPDADRWRAAIAAPPAPPRWSLGAAVRRLF